jgi:putative membrane protein
VEEIKMIHANCWSGHGFFFGGPWSMFIGIVFWISLILLIFYLISHLYKSNSIKIHPKNTALEILKRRYANGEINSEEYEKRRTILQI